jgi:hypothetical protein
LKSELVFALLVLSLVLPNLAFAEPGTASVDVDGTSYEVSYDATGLAVDGMEADVLTSTLTVLIATEDISSTLEITLERSFFDSKSGDADESFVVLADFDEAAFTEEVTDTVRTLTITVPSGTTSVDIIGTEFGTQEESPPAEETTEGEPEAPAEETPAEPEPEPEMQCGAGTVLKDGVCVLEETTEEEPEAPAEETPSESEMECGPGTVLEGGVCVLDKTCGPGTILKDGQCVLDETQQEPVSRSATTELVAPAIAAFVIAFIIMIILWAIGRAGRKKSS